ncbi:MAG: hypothetical protein RQM92_05715 [Candidatus Syntrophopropionicum ammoniitolerans]
MDIKNIIREIPDFPREGINYKDVSTLLLDSDAYRRAVQELAAQCKHKQADLIVCPKTRGLMIGNASGIHPGDRAFDSYFARPAGGCFHLAL